jgi:hypothetical protein
MNPSRPVTGAVLVLQRQTFSVDWEFLQHQLSRWIDVPAPVGRSRQVYFGQAFDTEGDYAAVQTIDERQAVVPIDDDKPLDMRNLCRTEKCPLQIPLYPGALKY